jgi:opacity protein-like surface antigen
MKIKLLVAAAATVVASSAMAQSAFQGFYGQIGTGYESNEFGSTNSKGTQTGITGDTWNSGNQNASGLPLVIGLGYNYSVAPKWLLGLGVDYSALSQETSTYRSTYSTFASTYISGSKLQASNRINIFATPGYVIDKDKLVYLKAGYSMVTIKNTNATYYTDGADASQNGPISLGTQSKTVGGYVVGLGYKQMITAGFYGFAEANYMSYSKPSFAATTSSAYTLSSNPSLNSFQALIGVGYKF